MAYKITYDDKVSLTTSALPRVNKCTDTDLNEIKNVVNGNADIMSTLVPIGSIISYAGSTAPTNWLICDGSAISRTTYSDLYNLIGTAFGQGDGSTTFNLPDLRGKVAVGKDEDDTDFDGIGNVGGEKAHTLTVPELARHKHLTVGNFGGTAGDKHLPQFVYKEADWNDGDVNENAQYTGENQAHNNLQPYIVLNKIIKAVKEG